MSNALYNRRKFLTHGAGTMAGALSLGVPVVGLAPRVLLGQTPELAGDVQDPRLKSVLQRGLDAASSAGASYADVRFTHERQLETGYRDGPGIREIVSVNVRALVNGYWGFAAGADVSPDALAQLGRSAAELAQVNAVGKTRITELAPASVVSGHWVTPIEIDPFTVNPAELRDYLRSLHVYATFIPRSQNVNTRVRYIHSTIEKAFASTAGSYCTQRLCASEGELAVFLRLPRVGPVTIDLNRFVQRAAVGFELFTAPPLREHMDTTLAQMGEWGRLTPMPVEPGRYDLLLNAGVIAQALSQSIGRATQADRVFGYEANAGGTSYVTHPMEMVGTLSVGAPLLRVTANRSDPGALATCAWDDEGVVPDSFTMIDRGVIMNLGTGRESASWMTAPTRNDAPVRSRGCMAAPSAAHVPMVHTPNLIMTPNAQPLDTNGLMAGMEDGLAMMDFAGSNLRMDHQQMTGQTVLAGMCVVKGGKRVGRPSSALELHFRTSEFWKNLMAIGGASSAQRWGFEETKGQPEQSGYHSVTAVPAVVKQLALFDPGRR